MARESSLWAWLSKARHDFGSTLHIQRIENFVGAGTPDVEGFLQTPEMSGQFWLELKSIARPARATTPLRFPLKDRKEQVEFMRKRWEIGGNCFWLLQVGSGYDRVIYLAPGPLGEALRNGMIEAQLALACVDGGIFMNRGTAAKTFSAGEVLLRVISCRKSPFRFRE